MSTNSEYVSLLKYLKENEGKLRILLSSGARSKHMGFKLKGKKSSRTIFMSEQLQFLMNEYCIENDLRIGDFVESAIIEQLNRNGMEEKLREIISIPSENAYEKKQGEIEKEQVLPEKTEGESQGENKGRRIQS